MSRAIQAYLADKILFMIARISFLCNCINILAFIHKRSQLQENYPRNSVFPVYEFSFLWIFQLSLYKTILTLNYMILKCFRANSIPSSSTSFVTKDAISNTTLLALPMAMLCFTYSSIGRSLELSPRAKVFS